VSGLSLLVFGQMIPIPGQVPLGQTPPKIPTLPEKGMSYTSILERQYENNSLVSIKQQLD